MGRCIRIIYLKLLEVIAHEEPSLRKNSSYEGMNNHSIRISHSWRCRTCSYFMVRDYDPIRSLIHCFKCIVIVIQIILSLFSTYRLRDRLITGNCVVNSKKGLDFRTWKQFKMILLITNIYSFFGSTQTVEIFSSFFFIVYDRRIGNFWTKLLTGGISI